MSLKTFKEAHEWFYGEHKFKWVGDKERLGHPDKWLILKPANGFFLGDCEDAVLTIIDKAITLGIPESRLYVCRVATSLAKKGHKFDHAIALYIDDSGKWWLSDNRYNGSVVNLFDISGYTFYDAVSIDNLRGKGSPKLIAE